MCATSAVVVDLPFVPVIAMNGSLGCAQSPLAGEHFDVADDLDTALARLDDCPMRLGMRQRHPRRQHQCRKSRPVDRREVDERDTLTSCRLTPRRAVIPRCDVGAAFEQRARGSGPRSAETEDSNRFALKGGSANHRQKSIACRAI